MVSYVQAVVTARLLANNASKLNEWDKIVRLQLALARSLRLTVQSRLDPETVARATKPDDGRRPWLRNRPEPWE